MHGSALVLILYRVSIGIGLSGRKDGMMVGNTYITLIQVINHQPFGLEQGMLMQWTEEN